LKEFKIIAFTHKVAELNEIGRFHLDAAIQEQTLLNLKAVAGLDELMYLSTCNRVEFLIITSKDINKEFLYEFFGNFNPTLSKEEISVAAQKALIFEGEEALTHLFNVASSVDSLVVGEREIITQVRSSYETSVKQGLSGDLIRIVIKKTIEVAKRIYTQTQIAGKPVSVVSLAYRRLRELQVKDDARFLIIGAGQTNTLMAQYLKKHHFGNFTVFNRTLANAQKLAAELKGTAFPLSELSSFKGGFDVIITCTGSSDTIITKEIYDHLLEGCSGKKAIIDLAIPNDVAAEVIEENSINYIEISSLKAVASENLKERHKEIERCAVIIEQSIQEFLKIYKTRLIEQAMKGVPLKVKEIKENAISSVFAKEMDTLDVNSKEVLEKILAYMEKKYISVPMKMAREILLDNQ
jgi:glutamyl-tRNA reductase